ITVEYVSTLNDEAVIGVPGNPNVMYKEYSNNPTDETSTGTTQEDKVVVFTYEVIIDKVDENGNPLPGAAFELYKWVIDEEYPEGHWVLVPGEVNGESSADGDGAITTINGKPVTYIPNAENVEYYKITDRPNENSPLTDIYLKVTDVEAVAAAVANGLSLGVPYYEMRNGQIVKVQGNFSYTINSLERATSAGTKFTWKGIDDGIYKLVETVTPPKYNPIADIEFVVTAEHEILSEDPQLLDAIGQGEHIVFNPTDANIGILESTVVNEQGATLPSTGGIGTTIFYVLGALMVLSAGIFLVIRKIARGQV
ncbi:MAG: LPXTG cell wall anchor domain-containing protein, partial [Oscillospiraceae bacterium]|nr:LPXTG cell wall anchor domain-containing protein [Oscillospiraceae bacterium]